MRVVFRERELLYLPIARLAITAGFAACADVADRSSGVSERPVIYGDDNRYDGLVDCADDDCEADPACATSCLESGSPCVANSDCCSGKCKFGSCR